MLLPIAAFTSPDSGRTTMRLGNTISDPIFLSEREVMR